MNIYSQLKTLALLCALPISSTFAAEPAKPYEALAEYGQPAAAIPASLQAELKRIEDLPDYKVFTEVMPTPIDKAEQYLRENEDSLKGSHHSLSSAHAKHRRSGLKYCAIEKELTSCPDGALKQTLQIELDEARDQCNAHRQEVIRCANDYVKNQPGVAYDFMVYRHNALANQASILLAQQQIKESQWQQEKQLLLAQLSGYQLLEDGPQIEGVPNVPGGVKPKLKRSGSF